MKYLRHWFYWVALLRCYTDIAGLGLFAYAAAVIYTSTVADKIWITLILTIWTIGCINGFFIIARDTRFSHSIPGTVAVQQSVSMALGLLSTTLVILAYIPSTSAEFNDTRDVLSRLAPWILLFAASAGCSLLMFATLLFQVIALARRSGRPIASYWLANAGEVSMGVNVRSSKPTWCGFPRQDGFNSVPSIRRAAFPFVWGETFVIGSFTRRVRPVEPIAFALLQNMFAIAAVALVMTRVTTLLSQVQNAGFLTRTVVRECGPKFTVEYVLVGHKEDRGIDSPPDNSPDPSYEFQVRLSRRGSQSVEECSFEEIFPWYRDDLNRTNWFRRYSCPNSGGPIDYAITTRNNASQGLPDDYPKLWFRDPAWMTLENNLRLRSVPYLTPPLQPSPGTYAMANFTRNTRRYIVSSGLRDAVTGSQPTYVDVPFDSLAKISVVPLNTTISACQPRFGNLTVVACGTRYPSTGVASYPSATYEQLKVEPEGPYCRVIEDYRQSSAFDVLGSIGGLLALLQGIHVFLFGRPLFWGMFGSKTIVPFGLCGRFATKSFRQRLQDHYSSGAKDNAFRTSLTEHDAASVIRMNRFLLDYVLDMGPASLPEVMLEPEQRHSDMDDSVIDQKGVTRVMDHEALEHLTLLDEARRRVG